MEKAGMNEDEAKCYILLSKTQRAARKWINEQDDGMMSAWNILKEAFIERFPKVMKKGKTEAVFMKGKTRNAHMGTQSLLGSA